MLDAAEAEAKATEDGEQGPAPQTKTKVLADGTYATETVFSSTVKLDTSRSTKPPLRCEFSYISRAIAGVSMTRESRSAYPGG